MQNLFSTLSGWLRAAVVLAIFALGLAYFWDNPKSAFWVLIVLSAFSFFSFSFYLLAASLLPNPKLEPLKKWPSVTVIVPCFNSAKTLASCLQHISSMGYPGKIDYLLIDDCSSDGSREIAAKFKKFKVVKRGERGGKASALNHGISLAKGELVACIDSDTYPPKDALVKMVPYFHSRPRVGAVTVFITAAHPRNLLERMQELEYYTAFGFVAKTMAKINGLMVTPGPMSIYSRKVMGEVGGFDERNMTEDMEIGLRLQEHHYGIECCCETSVPTEIPSTLGKLYRQRIRWYRGTIYNLVKYLHMFANKKYSDFGFFSYPSTSFYVAMTMVLWTVMVFSFASSAAQNAMVLGSWLKVGALPPFYSDGLLVLNSIFIFMLCSIAIWWYFLFRSIRLVGIRLCWRHVVPGAMIILAYPVLNSFFYFASLLKEAKGSVFHW